MAASTCCCLILGVPQEHVLVMTRFGKYQKLIRAGSGITVYNCCFEEIASIQSLKLESLEIYGNELNAKTIDDTFLNIEISIQYRVISEKDAIYKAVFTLADAHAQIKAYVLDVVRTAVTKLSMRQVYEEKDAIAQEVKQHLTAVMANFGFQIIATPITNVQPADPGVIKAMDSKTQNLRLLEAARARNETRKLEVVRRAEADAETMKLAGEGVSLQRQAIVDGLRESVAAFQGDIAGVTSKDVLELILVTQYFDMMKDMGASGAKNTLFVQHSPGAVSNIGEEIRNGFKRANMQR